MNKAMSLTEHARERCKQRGITKKPINIVDIKKMPIYNTENGCTKYLDISNLIYPDDPLAEGIVYYVRGSRIVTMIATNPIQMLRYYAFSQNIKFDTLCRDNVFNNCKRGSSCKKQHLQINV